MKKMLSKITEKTIMLLMVLSLAINNFVPIMAVYAETVANYTITFEATGTHKMAIDAEHLKIDGEYVELRNSFNQSIGTASCSSETSCQISNITETGELNFGGNSFTLYNTAGHVAYTMGTKLSSNTVFKVENYSSGGGNIPGPTGGTNNIEFDISVTGTHIIASINGKTIVDDAGGNFKSTYTGTIEKAGTSNSAETNTLLLNAPFGESPLINIKINDISYNKDTKGVVFNEEDNSYSITVPGAAKYIIRAEKDPNYVVPRTIIWANPDYKPTDDADAEWVASFTLKHGKAEVAAVYDDKDTLLDPSKYIGNESENNGLNKGFGWVKVYPGYKVVFNFIPEYGYQLTEIKLNETPMKAGEEMNSFTIEIPNDSNAGNVHFAATFTKTEDVVKTSTEKVASGTIKIGNNEINAGSTVLSVNDATLSDEKKEIFTTKAGDYKVSNIFDIKLSQVFYKGSTDPSKVWSKPLGYSEDLKTPAVITLNLEKGIDGNEVVLIHEKEDGTYETIETTYNESSHTISFSSSSFSNYAIAAKTVAKPKPNNSNSSNYRPEETPSDSTQDSGTTLNTDSSNSSDAETTIKTEKKLPDNSALSVKEISIPTEVKKEEKNLKKLFDISVLSDSGEVIKVTDNKMQITISLEEELQGFNTYKVVYIDNGKIVETLPATVVDGKLTFETTHLSEYGIVAYNEDKDLSINNPQTGDNIRMYINLFILSAGGLAIAALQLKKRKKITKNN